MDIPNESSYNVSMSAELRMLETAIADFDREADDDFVDTRRLSAAIDRLQGKLCRVVAAARTRGDHLLVGQKRQYIDQDHWISYAERFSLKDLRYLTYEARVRWDCEGFERQTEEDFELRSLDLSETTGGMYRLDAWLDPVGGAALKAAIESLSNPLGTEIGRASCR